MVTPATNSDRINRIKQDSEIPKMEDKELTEQVIGCAMKVHSTLGPGFLESVYRKALAHELRKAGLQVECERPITVYYDGVAVGDFSADLLVESRVMVELKANQSRLRPSPANYSLPS